MHRLDPLLRPRSVAVVGATDREGSVGRRTVHNLLTGGYEGNIYPVNPTRDTVLGLDCYPDMDSLPGPAEHVVFCVGAWTKSTLGGAAPDWCCCAMSRA